MADEKEDKKEDPKAEAKEEAKKEAEPKWFDALLKKYVALVEKGEKALDDGDINELGKLLNENHTLCQELTVSCKELDDLVMAARDAGAIGAKMSGTGRGGLMLALTPTEEIQDMVAAALEKLAPQVWKTTFAVKRPMMHLGTDELVPDIDVLRATIEAV